MRSDRNSHIIILVFVSIWNSVLLLHFSLIGMGNSFTTIINLTPWDQNWVRVQLGVKYIYFISGSKKITRVDVSIADSTYCEINLDKDSINYLAFIYPHPK